MMYATTDRFEKAMSTVSGFIPDVSYNNDRRRVDVFIDSFAVLFAKLSKSEYRLNGLITPKILIASLTLFVGDWYEPLLQRRADELTKFLIDSFVLCSNESRWCDFTVEQASLMESRGATLREWIYGKLLLTENYLNSSLLKELHPYVKENPSKFEIRYLRESSPLLSCVKKRCDESTSDRTELDANTKKCIREFVTRVKTNCAAIDEESLIIKRKGSPLVDVDKKRQKY